jgi:hypothetical protein
MSAKTIFIIIFTVLITIFLMVNTDAVSFDFIFVKKDISKLVIVGVCTLVGFILGFLAGRPRTTVGTYDKNGPLDYPGDRQKDDSHKNELSNEDRDYIR